MNKELLVVVSGGFDPLHVGHVRMINEAKNMGTRIVIIANNDIWLTKKKGYTFMPEKERVIILMALCRPLDSVLLTFHDEGSDRSVCQELRWIRENYKGEMIFANGGDRLADNVPEVKLCKELNIGMVFNVGGEKIQSSSELVNKYKEKKK